MPKVLFRCEKGIEEAEFSCAFDILKIAGTEITIVKVKENDKDTKKYFETKHGLKILCDKFIEDMKDEIYDLIVCCGGHHNSVF